VDSKDFSRDAQMKAVAATVRIVNRTDRSSGSGVIIGYKDETIYILTAAHVVKEYTRFHVSTFSEKSFPEEAKVYGEVQVLDKTRNIRDLALLAIPSKDPPPGIMPLCPLSRLAPLKRKKIEPFKVLSVGCSGTTSPPLCILETIVGDGKVSRPPERETARFWEVKNEQTEGRSGGPLLDKTGCLIGMASGTSEGRGYYTHASEIHVWLRSSKYAFLLPTKEKSDK
jgi:S1-C subfamily serine protease